MTQENDDYEPDQEELDCLDLEDQLDLLLLKADEKNENSTQMG